MMIKTIGFEGFKSLLSEELELGGLTLLTGINSSGKSSVIQGIRMLERISLRQDVMLEGHGTIEDLVNPYTETLEIRAETRFGTTSYRYTDKEIFTDYFDHGSFFKLTYIAADRYGPESFLQIYPGEKYDLGSRGENVFKVIDWYDTNSTNLPAIVKHPESQGTTFSFNLEAWLGVISPNHGFKAHVQELSDTSNATFHGRRAKNVGFGLSYVLPVIVALLQSTVQENSIVLIENPEAHLHPKGQTEMARLIARCVEAGTQVVIETHSDHIFDGIRVQAKESESAFHEQIKAYWFELDEKRNSVVEEVEIDENGRISQSPQGLFDQFEINARKLL
jgi:predicted ATPase